MVPRQLDPSTGGNKENSRTNAGREERRQANKRAGERTGGVCLISGLVFGAAAKQVGETEGARDELFLRFCWVLNSLQTGCFWETMLKSLHCILFYFEGQLFVSSQCLPEASFKTGVAGLFEWTYSPANEHVDHGLTDWPYLGPNDKEKRAVKLWAASSSWFHLRRSSQCSKWSRLWRVSSLYHTQVTVKFTRHLNDLSG